MIKRIPLEFIGAIYAPDAQVPLPGMGDQTNIP